MGIVPDARGQGIGTDLIAATIDDAWTRGFVRLELTVYADNPRAIELYEKAGFQHEGILVDAVRIDGVYGNSILMALVNR
jgi:RimJ/RimL family protein N-acetyltransferase